jgi:hypothetical protein
MSLRLTQGDENQSEVVFDCAITGAKMIRALQVAENSLDEGVGGSPRIHAGEDRFSAPGKS